MLLAQRACETGSVLRDNMIDEWSDELYRLLGLQRGAAKPAFATFLPLVDVDVRGYFDSIDWELLLKAVRKHTDCPWVLLYIATSSAG